MEVVALAAGYPVTISEMNEPIVIDRAARAGDARATCTYRDPIQASP